MPSRRDVTEVLDRDFLETRGRILEVAAALDRIDRAPGRAHEAPDRRLAQLRQAIEALLEPGPGPRRDRPAPLLARLRPEMAGPIRAGPVPRGLISRP